MKSVLVAIFVMFLSTAHAASPFEEPNCRWVYNNEYNDLYSCNGGQQTLTYQWPNQISKWDALATFLKYKRSHPNIKTMHADCQNDYVNFSNTFVY